MATNKVTYASLKLKANKEVKTFDFQDNQIEVLQYLPISSKDDLIAITLQKSNDDNIFNPLKLDVYFHLHLIYMYSNISFTDKQREDELKLYDILKTSGLMDKIIENIPEDEYNDLYNYLNEALEETASYNTSAAAIASKFINDLPTNAQAAMDIVNNFDKNKFSEVVNFATAANGGRPIE